jgi:hypothetical protein
MSLFGVFFGRDSTGGGGLPTPTSASSYESAALLYAVNHVSQSSTWQSVCGTTGRKRIVYFTGGQPELTGQVKPKNIDLEDIDFAAPLCFVSASEFTRERICQGYYRHKGQVELLFYLKPSTDQPAPGNLNWAIEKAGKIAGEIELNFGQSDFFSFGEVSTTIMPLTDPTGANAGVYIFGLTINWSNVP